MQLLKLTPESYSVHLDALIHGQPSSLLTQAGVWVSETKQKQSRMICTNATIRQREATPAPGSKCYESCNIFPVLLTLSQKPTSVPKRNTQRPHPEPERRVWVLPSSAVLAGRALRAASLHCPAPPGHRKGYSTVGWAPGRGPASPRRQWGPWVPRPALPSEP